MILKNFVFIFTIFYCVVLSINSFAQTTKSGVCSDKFEQISSQCIQKYSGKMNSNLEIEIPKKSEKILSKTYFYKTENGHFGKFTVRSSFQSKFECSIFLEAVTYVKGSSYAPNSTLTIKNEYNSWSTDRAGFGEKGSNDFVLERVNKKCIFKANLAEAVYYKNTKEKSLLSGNELLFYASLFLIGLSVYLVASSVFSDEEKYKAKETLEDAEGADNKKSKNQNDFLLKYTRPFFKRYFSPIVQGMKNKKKIRDKFKRKLANAGLSKDLSPEDFFAMKLFLIIAFPILFLALRAFLEETWPLAITLFLPFLGFKYPDIWINGKIERRKAEVARSMPFIVDMLALSVEAGLDFVAAMQRIIEKAPPSALTDEFEQLIKETRVGSSRAEALRQLAWRVDTVQVSSFCATLIAADSVGANIAPILKTLSGEMRQKKSADAEKAGATAATKILFPMMFLILPAVAIIIVAPILLEFMRGN